MEPECTLLPEQEDCVMLDWILDLWDWMTGDDGSSTEWAGVPDPGG